MHNINAQVLKIKEMLIRDELFWYSNNFSQLAQQQCMATSKENWYADTEAKG